MTHYHARRWVDAIPDGLTVVVGHAVTESRAVETTKGRQGGTAVFADTGFWSDGTRDCPRLELPVVGVYQAPKAG